MGNVNMEADQIHVRDNNHKTWRTVADALKALETSGESVAEDITELYTRDASRASKDDIANEFSAEQAYYAGDYVYYEGSLFKFTAFHAAGEWSSEDVTPAQIGNDIANISASVDYSTTEQPTGQKWIDGKEIYMKTLHVENAVMSGKNIEIDISSVNPDKCFIDYGASCAFDSDTHDWMSLSWVPAHAGVNYGIFAYVDVINIGRKAILISSSFDYGSRISDIYVTIRYTKSV